MSGEKSGALLVCVCTLGQRPNLWKLLVELSAWQENTTTECRILVALNGDSPIDEVSLGPAVKLIRVQRLGYASIRNAALGERRANEDLLFLDDDELPYPGQVEAFWSAKSRFKNSVFVGPVRSVSMSGSDLPLHQGRKIPSLKFGAKIMFGSAGNMYIPAAVFSKVDVYFDEFFDAGGEDTDLVMRLSSLGVTTRWVPDAIVKELTPSDRISQAYLSKRRLRNEIVYSQAIKRNLGVTSVVVRFSLLCASIALNVISSLFSKHGKRRLQQAVVALGALVKTSRPRAGALPRPTLGDQPRSRQVG